CPAPPDWRLHYRVTTVWEFHAGGNIWQPLQDTDDETRALTLSGFVRFAAPVNHQPGGVAGVSSAQFFIRCRIRDGRFECPPALAHVAFNAVPCEHALSIHRRNLGTAHGHPLVDFLLGAAPT